VGCRATALKKWLPPILAKLESLGLTELNEGTVALVGSSSDELRELRILNAQQSSTGTDYPGSIYCTLDNEPRGGLVPASSECVSVWIATFLKDTKQADVLSKLQSAVIVD